MLRSLLVFWLIAYSFRYRTGPWNFFQLNSDYFNGEKNIFSKLELNNYIPSRWRLRQVVDDGRCELQFPVFVKPEWGQNSHGVALARDLLELNRLRRTRTTKNVTYLLQESAPESREFEIFYVRSADDPDNAAILSITETVNLSDDTLVVNSIRNSNSCYCDITPLFNEKELQEMWQTVKSIGCFRIARVGLRADSLQALINGTFHVIEVNIFLPMPLVLLDTESGFHEKHSFIRKSMEASALLIRSLGQPQKKHPIFFRQLIAHYKVKE
ncbi:MAG: hypothetical protein ACN4GW_17160 [Desulforhopalus sp.]